MDDLVQRLRQLAARKWPDAPNQEHSLFGEAASEIERLRAQLAERDRDAEYLRWRLNEILPLFEEARDALPAISIAAAKLHRVDLSLGDRMDKAGTRTRAEFDAAIDAAMAPKP